MEKIRGLGSFERDVHSLNNIGKGELEMCC